MNHIKAGTRGKTNGQGTASQGRKQEGRLAECDIFTSMSEIKIPLQSNRKSTVSNKDLYCDTFYPEFCQTGLQLTLVIPSDKRKMFNGIHS